MPTRAREIQKLTMSVPATRILNLRAFLFLGMILFLLSPSAIHAAAVFSEEKLVGLLAAGDQNQAEAEVVKCIQEGDRSPRAIFWAAVLARSRFDLDKSMPLFAQLLASQPESLEGRASGFVLGIDTTKDSRTKLFYYNSLVAQTALEPKSIPLQWLSGIMAHMVREDAKPSGITDETRKRILAWGVESYWKALSLLGEQEGPYAIHETLANLLDDLEAHDQALEHRFMALKLHRSCSTLHGSAHTLHNLFQDEEALAYINEALALDGTDESCHSLKGDILERLDRLPEAIQSWNAAAEVATTDKSSSWDRCSRASFELGNLADAKFYSGKALSHSRPDLVEASQAYEIRDARLAAIVGELDGPERVKKAPAFDFNGNILPRDPKQAEDETASPLYKAASCGDVTALRAALPSPDINALSGKYKQTALMVAAQSGFTHIIDELLKHGAALDIVDLNGDTALHYATQFGQPPCVLRLLTAGAKTDIQDKWRQTPLTMAASSKDLRCFRALLPKSRLDQATPHGGTALHYASGYGNILMIRELIAAGADVNSTARGQKKELLSCPLATNGRTPTSSGLSSKPALPSTSRTAIARQPWPTPWIRC